ncbi:hypothetical protein F5Y12DRAFT_120820 [Xylaria sp. FL1777]|nr:hypothetical protein F5Y12DRAFT_120820 [Xylaria sp. FL1777]
MSLPSHLARSLNNRRHMAIEGTGSQKPSTNAPQAEVTTLQPPIQSTGRRASSQLGGGSFTTHIPSPFDFRSFGQPSPVGTGHNIDYSNPTSFQNSRSIVGNTPLGSQSIMTSVINPSAAVPGIVIRSCDQQQSALPGPSSFSSSRGQLNPSGFGTANRFVPDIGQRRNSTRDQNLSNFPRVEPLVVVEWCLPGHGTVNEVVPRSGIYRDVIKGPDREGLIRPWPPGRSTVTEMGFDPNGGEFIQLTIRNREEQDVPLLLTIMDRNPQVDRRDGAVVDLVLGRDYLEQLVALRRASIMQFPNQSYPSWQMAGRPQNVTMSSENLVFGPGHQNVPDLSSSVWPSGSNQIHGLHPHYPATSRSYITMSSSQDSSGLAASSTTTPDRRLGSS